MPASAASSGPSGEPDLRKEEWQACRDVLDKFDGRLADLRKYAFSLITGLLTADSILGQLVGNSGKFVPGYVRLAIFSVTLLLILGARLLDNIYRSFQRAASMRARVLEVRLNLELTETIADKYKADRTAWWVDAVYYVFAGAALGLGAAALYPDDGLIEDLILFTILSWIGILVTGLRVRVQDPWPDWTLDRLTCPQGEKVRITLTNLGEKRSLWFENHAPAWTVTRFTTHTQEATDSFETGGEREGELGPGDSYDWLWEPTEKTEPDFYQVIPYLSAAAKPSGHLLRRDVVFLSEELTPRPFLHPGVKFPTKARPLHRKVEVVLPKEDAATGATLRAELPAAH